MKQNGVLLTIFVDDYDAAIAFYVDCLGLFEIVADTQTSESSRYVCVAMKAFVDKFMIHLKVPTTPGGTKLIGAQGDGEVFLTIPVDDIVALHSKLLMKDVQFDGEIEWVPYGGGVVVSDPFGNRLSLFQHFVSRFP